MKKIRSFEEKEVNVNLKRIAKSGFLVLLALLFSKILVYGYRVIIARYYGSEIYGLFSLGVMVLGIVVALSLVGFIEGILRFIPRYRGLNEGENINYLLKFVSKVILITSLFFGILLFFFSSFISENIFHNSGLTIFLKIFSLLIPISVFSDVYIATLRAYEKIGWYSFLSYVFHNLVKVILLILFVYLGLNGGNYIAYSYLIGILANLIFAYVLLNKTIKKSCSSKYKKLNILNVKKIKNELFSYSMPLVFFSVIALIYHWVDSFSLGFLKSAVEVGLYNAAVPIAALLSIAPELFIKLFFPIINKEYSKNNLGVIEELSKQVMKWIFMINLPLMILLIVFPKEFIGIIFGNEYLIAKWPLRILAFSGIVSSMFSIIPYRLISMAGKSKVLLVNIIIFGSLNVILNFIFIPMNQIWFIENANGINGAAIATLISVILSSIVLTIQSKKYLSINIIRRKMVLVLLSGISSMTILIYILSFIKVNYMSFIVLSIFFILIYLLGIFLIKGFDKNDLDIIKSIKLNFNNLILQSKS